MRSYLKKLVILGLALPVLALPVLAQARSGDTPPTNNAISARPQIAASTATPAGLWRTANGDAIIQIAPCGDGLCGAIVGMYLGPNDPTPKDWAGASQCRLTIIQAAPQLGDDGQPYWAGHIVNPRDGASYNATIRVNAQNQLLLRGYIGLPIFGQTQTWTPYHGGLAENCRLPSQPVG